VYDRSEEPENCELAEEASHENRLESHSTDVQSQSRLSSSDHDVTGRCSSECSPDTHCPMMNRCEPDEASACSSLCDTVSAAEADGRELVLSTTSHSVIDSHPANTPDVTDAVEDAIGSLEPCPDSSDRDHHLLDSSRENATLSSISEPDLPLCSDLNPSRDSSIGRILSAQTESRLSIETETYLVDHKETSDNGGLTQTEAFPTNTDIGRRSTSNVDTACIGKSDSEASNAAAMVTNSDVIKSSGRSGVRSILTASLSDVTGPAEETVTHIGSTHVHITDELSIINGVVQPVESPVKIGEFLTRHVEARFWSPTRT